MLCSINTNVFTIVEDNLTKEKGTCVLDLTDEFGELSAILHVVLNKWNEVQCRHTAELASVELPAMKLRAMAETIIAVCDRAIENSDRAYKAGKEV